MKPLSRQSLAEQTAGHLRAGFRSGRWQGILPGVVRLAETLTVSKVTVRTALHILEREGLLKSNGAGRSRKIVPLAQRKKGARRTLRVAVLLPLLLEEDNSHSQRLILRLVRAIEHDGHECIIADKSLKQLGYRLDRLARMVQATAADVWIIFDAGYEVLRWFQRTQIPSMALGGRIIDLPLACTRADLSGAVHSAVDALIAHGHRRIVMISPRHWRHPELSPSAGAFSRRMMHHGLVMSAYNLPDWDESAEGLQRLLQALFQTTPPTALLLLEPAWTVATCAFLAIRSLRVPEDVSLISLMSDPILAMSRPMIAHFDWQIVPHLDHITHWVRSVARGKSTIEINNVPCTFDPGGTLGPVPARVI